MDLTARLCLCARYCCHRIATAASGIAAGRVPTRLAASGGAILPLFTKAVLQITHECIYAHPQALPIVFPHMSSQTPKMSCVLCTI